MAGHYGANPYKWDGGANAPHIARYFLASGWVMPWETVLDAASATGYGSHILALRAKHVIGYEVDEGAVEVANRDWKADNNEFHVKDLSKCELPDVDVMVSIETMEHVYDLAHFVDQAQKHVRRMIVMTVPLGGTTWDYKDQDPKDPASECNDFITDADADRLICTNGWRKASNFQFGYSHFGVYIKKGLEKPE